MRRALVALNTDLPPLDLWRPWLAKANLVVAADGGANRLLRIGVEPDAVVGDMDSVLGSARRRLPRDRFHERRDVDSTDLEKALDFARERGCREATIVVGSARRLDHALGHLSILFDRAASMRLRIVDDDFVTEPVRRRLSFRAPLGTIVSLWTPSTARGVSTAGLRWPLREVDLARGTLGIHNEVAANPVEVRVRDGELLLMRGHRVEPNP